MMYFTSILWFEMGLAVLLGFAFLSTRVELALFLYAFALGFPDLAYPLDATINLRLDDALLLLFLARTLLWTRVPTTRGQRNLFLWQGLFLGACLISIAIETAQGNAPAGYETAKMAGCVVILFVLPRVLQSGKNIRYFIGGLMCAGVALAIQVFQHLGASTSSDFANIQEWKSSASFGTWNPNTIGQAAILLVFASGVGRMVFSRTPSLKPIWPCLAMGFALMPALLFVRGTTLSIAAGIVLFLSMTRQWKWLLVFAALGLSAVAYVHSTERGLFEDAAAVNLSTGEGFSSRFARWDMALQAVRTRPLLGQGFGQELAYLTRIGSEGRAHDAYLTVWLELGLGGLALFLAALSQFVRAGWRLYRIPQTRWPGALIVALILVLGLDSLGLSTLYWEKLPFIALSLAVAVVGLCERNAPEFAANEVRSLKRVPLEQLS